MPYPRRCIDGHRRGHTDGLRRGRLDVSPGIAMSLLLAFGLSGCTRDDSPGHIAAACERPPIVFVHGLDQGPGIFAPVIAHLERQGVRASCLHAIELTPANGDNVRAAELQITPFIEELLGEINRQRAATGRPPIDKVYLVGHSMGALSARWYTAVLHPERVALFVATSGANHGTTWRCESPFGEGHRQMCPPFAATPAQSALQFSLNGAPGADVDETPYGTGSDAPGVRSLRPDAARAIVYLTLRAADDGYILPADSLLLDGAGGLARETDPELASQTLPGNFLLREPSGHDELLSSPAALRWLDQVLRASGETPSESVPKDRS